MEASREGRERPELEGAKELRDEFVPSYSYILEILMEEAAEEEEKKEEGCGGRGRYLSVKRLHPRDSR